MQIAAIVPSFDTSYFNKVQLAQKQISTYATIAAQVSQWYLFTDGQKWLCLCVPAEKVLWKSMLLHVTDKRNMKQSKLACTPG
jgi:hypothetical protein